MEQLTSLSIAIKGYSCAWARSTGVTHEISAARLHPALSWGALVRVFLLGILAGVLLRLPSYRFAYNCPSSELIGVRLSIPSQGSA